MPLLSVPGKHPTTIYYEVVGDGPPAPRPKRSQSEPARRRRGGRRKGGSAEPAEQADGTGAPAAPAASSWLPGALGRLLRRRATTGVVVRTASPGPTAAPHSRSPSPVPKAGSGEEEGAADPAAPDPRPCVVFIMGLGATHGCWDPQVDELLAWGAAAEADGALPPPSSTAKRPSRPPMRALLLDNRGVGGSGVPKSGRAYSSAIMARDVLAVMVSVCVCVCVCVCEREREREEQGATVGALVSLSPGSRAERAGRERRSQTLSFFSSPHTHSHSPSLSTP